MFVKRVEVVKELKLAFPFLCCPVIRECQQKKTQIEKKNYMSVCFVIESIAKKNSEISIFTIAGLS